MLNILSVLSLIGAFTTAVNIMCAATPAAAVEFFQRATM